MAFHNLSRFEALATALPLTSGKVFLVADSADAWFPRLQALFPPDYDGEVRLFTNLDTAVGACTANRGDVIVVLPGFSLTITAAAGLDLDIAGITLLGIGNGTDRPTINFTTAAGADVDIDAANITIDNFYFDLTGVDALAAAIDVNADDFTIQNCVFTTSDSDGQMLNAIQGVATANRMKILNNVFTGDSSLGNVAAIQLIGGDRHLIEGNTIIGSYNDSVGGAAPIAVLTTLVTNTVIRKNTVINYKADSTIAIKGVAACTGMIEYNSLGIGTDTSPTTSIDTPGSMRLNENYCSTDSGETGGLVGTLST